MRYYLFMILSVMTFWKDGKINPISVTVTEVTYVANKNIDLPSKSESILKFISNKSCYIQGEYNTSTPSNTVQQITTGNIFNKKFYTNLDDKKLYTLDKFTTETILAEEQLTNIKWQINPEKTDTIMGLKCIEAKGNFRGRNYTVYFTPEIPVPFGPWKLQGLPGLILEAWDDLDQIHFSATKIENQQRKQLEDLIAPVRDYKIISLKEYVSQEEKDIKERIKRLIASMPKDSKIGNINIKNKRGLELEYEWDK